MIIYMAVNVKNGKKYIGQTVYDLEKRKRQHWGEVNRGRKCAFYNALRKYGANGFAWEILYTADSIEELNAREEYFIAAYTTHTRKNGYNIMFGGGNRRTPLSVRKKISVANTGKVFSAETRRKLSEATKGEKNHNFGKKISDEQRKKISEAVKRKYTDKKHPNFGKKRSVEQRKKLSESKRGEKNHFFGKKHSEDSRAKISEAKTGEKHHLFGKKHSNETKKKMSAAQKGKTLSIEVREKMIGTHFDPKIYMFYHPRYGIAWCTKYALRKEFSLHCSALSGVADGSTKSHKGWRIASPEYIQELEKRNEGVSCN